MVFPDDVLNKIETEFEEKDKALVMDLLRKCLAEYDDTLLEGRERIVRCILFGTNGSIEQLKIHIDYAIRDYRDVIVQAEYDDEMNWLRNFIRPFGNDAITEEDLNIDDSDSEGDDLPF